MKSFDQWLSHRDHELYEGMMDFIRGMFRRKMPPKILFVCTGNTCRSPMAEGFAKKLLPNAEISSAGMTADGEPASPNSVQAAKELGADISGHSSRILTTDMVDNADLIFTMSPTHKARVLALSPDAGNKTIVLNVDDPFGGNLRRYQQTAKQIYDAIQNKVVPTVRSMS